MSTKYAYFIVLLIVLIAWFGGSTIKPLTKIVSDPALLNIDPSGLIKSGDCNLEFINDSPINTSVHSISTENKLKLVGWAMDVDRLLLPNQIIVRFSNTENTNKSESADFYAVAQMGFVRDDVRDYFELSDQVTASGFELSANIKNVPLGQYALTLIVEYKGDYYVCDNGRKIRVN